MRFNLVNPMVLLLAAIVALSLLVARDVQADGHHHHHGLLSGLLSPFRSTLDHARKFLGGGGSGNSSASPQDDALASDGSSLSERTYEMFRRLYNKTYSSPEEIRRRMGLFFKRRQEIEQSIRDYAQGRMSFSMRENPFIDWDEDELKALSGAAPPKKPEELMPEERQVIVKKQRNRRRRRRSIDEPAPSEELSNRTWYDFEYADQYEDEDDDEVYEFDDEDPHGYDDIDFDDDDLGLNVQAPESLPASKDWRTSNCVSTPIDQQRCGCCYAIATMSVIETMRCLNKVSAPLLSPQHIIDCSTPRAGYQNFGCNGGWPTRVLKYLQDTGVAVRETCYPFVRRQQTCRLRQVSAQPGCTVSASPTDTQLTYKILNNERDILYHVARTGPVVTVMRATNKFLFYANGIFDDATCSRRRDDVDHAIVIVGYGRENGLDYWLIKNSWSTTLWGQGGYGKYRRGTNACSIGHWGWVVTS